ncbi:hypothetical protein EMIT074MI3_12532 [Bacillus licheniformis]|jgi:glucose/arabinose dehydrogenase
MSSIWPGCGERGFSWVDPAEAKAVKWLGGYGRIRDVKVIGDDLYFITNNGDGRGEKKQTDDRLIRVPLPDQ